jgi:hypothetical protein
MNANHRSRFAAAVVTTLILAGVTGCTALVPRHPGYVAAVDGDALELCFRERAPATGQRVSLRRTERTGGPKSTTTHERTIGYARVTEAVAGGCVAAIREDGHPRRFDDVDLEP